MAVNLREIAIINDYGDRESFIQALVSVPANSSVVVTSSPGAGQAFLSIHGVQGSVVTGQITMQLYRDDTVIADITLSDSFEHLSPSIGEYIFKNQLRIVLTNGDSTAHVANFHLQGVQIPIDKIPELVKRIKMDDHKEILESMKDILIRILLRLEKVQFIER